MLQTIRLVEHPDLEKQIDDPRTRIIDPRSRVKYLQGHIPKAINLPIGEVFDKNNLALYSDAKLREIFGTSGVSLESNVMIYDSYDGQSGAMLAWLLEYLGHHEVSILSEYAEGWAKRGGKILYRPVTYESKIFNGNVTKSSRANIDDVTQAGPSKLVDLRGPDEFQGRVSSEPRSGHIPGAINIPWTNLVGRADQFFKSQSELKQLFTNAGLKDSTPIITYCTNGPRAALGYIALHLAGFENVRVYDGSFHEWAERTELPVAKVLVIGERPKPNASPAPPCVIDSLPEPSPAK